VGVVSMSAEVNPTNWISLFVFLVFGYVCIFLQARLTLFRDFFGFQVDLVPGLVVYSAIHFNFFMMMMSASLLGLLMDILSANPLGTTMLSYVIVCFLAFYFREVILPEQFTAQFVLGAGATAATALIALAILYIAGEQPLVNGWSMWHGLLVSASGGMFTPLWFKLFMRLDDALRYKEMPESTYRQDREIARGRY
jgi:rod shape-determining protein MreD